MTRPRHGAALLLAGCLLTSCAGVAGGPDLSGSWELVDGTVAGKALPDPEQARATLVVEGNSLTGRSFCNTYSSAYSLDDGDLVVDGLGGTEMGCEPEIMAAESSYLAALGAGGEVTRVDDGLLLTGEDATLRFRLLPPVPTSELTGTDWVLETLLQGEVASSVAAQSSLRFDADGTFRGTTACGNLSGTWTTDGDELTFPEFDADERDCPAELRPQDDHERAALVDGVRIEIVEDRLTVAGGSGLGVVYRDGSR
jgi:heat shock protein HslJ